MLKRFNNLKIRPVIFTVLFLLLLAISSFAALQAVVGAREYLPGDFVHVVVDAPSDTVQITAVMPDGTAISLVQERITGIWRGVWAVPAKFNRGTYTAKLTAVDVGGNIFEGRSDPFTILEMALATKVTSADVVVQPIMEKITTPPPQPRRVGAEDKQFINEIKKLIAQQLPGPEPVLKPSEKEVLTARNMELGKEALSIEHFAEATTYFRIVLHLDPNNKLAGAYLAESQQKLDSAKQKLIDEQLKSQKTQVRLRQVILFITLLVVGFVLLVYLLLYIYRLLFEARKEVCPPVSLKNKSEPGANLMLSELEDDTVWTGSFGWSANPFRLDAIKGLFKDETHLEYDGFVHFIVARIESVGGNRLSPFTESAVEKIFKSTKGNPKEAILLCDWAVKKAIRQNKKEISTEFVMGYKLPHLEGEGKKWPGSFGWKQNPFRTDEIRNLAKHNERLEYNGLVDFIRAKVESVGGKDVAPFTSSALEKIFNLAKGNLKDALIICAWAVNQAVLQGQGEITAELVKSYEAIQPKLVLIADDEEAIRSSLEVILKNGGGYRTEVAVDGQEALDKIKKNLYDCVLLDIVMPKINGYEILKKAREIYPEMPIFFVTGKGTPEKTMDSVAHYELTGYIEKPFTPEKVLDVVGKALKG